MTSKEIRNIVMLITAQFPSFGGGIAKTLSNPLSVSLKNTPPQFAEGVDIEAVVRSVLSEVRKIEREKAKKFDKKRWSRH